MKNKRRFTYLSSGGSLFGQFKDAYPRDLGNVNPYFEIKQGRLYCLSIKFIFEWGGIDPNIMNSNDLKNEFFLTT